MPAIPRVAVITGQVCRMKREARRVYMEHFSSFDVQIDSLLAVVSQHHALRERDSAVRRTMEAAEREEAEEAEETADTADTADTTEE